MVKGLVSRARFSCLCHLLLSVWLQTSDFTHHSASGTLIVPALGEGQGVGWIEHLVKGCYCHSPEIPWSPGCSGGAPGSLIWPPFLLGLTASAIPSCPWNVTVALASLLGHPRPCFHSQLLVGSLGYVCLVPPPAALWRWLGLLSAPPHLVSGQNALAGDLCLTVL